MPAVAAASQCRTPPPAGDGLERGQDQAHPGEQEQRHLQLPERAGAGQPLVAGAEGRALEVGPAGQLDAENMEDGAARYGEVPAPQRPRTRPSAPGVS